MKIYKKDSKGRIRSLNIYVGGDTLYQVSGLLAGKKVTHSKVCKPKNIGKKNATTGATQAISEKEAIVIKKLKEGYFITEEGAESTNVILPMLAKEFGKEEKKVVYPCFVQPKFDGMRCLAIMKNNTITLMSRQNREITTMDHIKPDLMARYKEGLILDGELYAHGLTFQENMKLLKKYRKGKSEKVNYHIYDTISGKAFEDRTVDLALLEFSKSTYLKSVQTLQLVCKEDLEYFHDSFLAAGFEGTMVRWGTEGYKINGRSSNLLKYKDFKDVALPVIDIIESDRVLGHGIVVIEYNGHRSKTGSKISHADRKDLLTKKDEYIGLTAEIRYFEETDKGALRFPVFIGFRADK